MKVVWKIVLVVALALFVLGAAMIGVSLFSGGSLEGVRNNVPLMNFEQSFPDETPGELRIELPAGKLTVEQGDVLRVEAKNVSESGFYCGVENGVLTVRETSDASWSNRLSRLISLGKREAEYHVWLPRGLDLSRVVLQMTAGQAQVLDLRADVLLLQMAAGNAEVTGLRSRSTVVNMAAGALALYDVDTDILMLQIRAGSVGVSGTVRENCSADLSAGSAVLRLTGEAGDCAAQIEVGGGGIVYDGASYTIGRYSVGSGPIPMALRCGAGRIEVSFHG